MTDPAQKRRSLIALLGPGLMLAGAGVGAGDLAGGAFAGMNLGVAVLWAVVLGAFFKYIITEGMARWQLATGTTLLEGSVLHLGRVVQWIFLVYLLVWSFGVGASLISACGVAAHAIFPFMEAETGKIVFGLLHSLIGLALVWIGSFRFFETFMSVMVAIMIVIVVTTGALIGSDWGAILSGLTTFQIPDKPQAVGWTLTLMGGVGGTLTVLCYGYWIRERNRTIQDLSVCRMDLGISYSIMALFGIAMVIIADGMSADGKSAELIVNLADRLGDRVGPVAGNIFLIGAWAAVFSSLLGVWQAVPYLFADFWHLFTHRKALTKEAFRPYEVNTKGRAYRGYLIALALVPMIGLQVEFKIVQLANSVFGALVMPMMAAVLLILNGREKWIGKEWRNRWYTVVLLIVILSFFAWVGLSKFLK